MAKKKRKKAALLTNIIRHHYFLAEVLFVIKGKKRGIFDLPKYVTGK